jgi:5-formyltetrahydrofolate cyclo-ligase
MDLPSKATFRLKARELLAAMSPKERAAASARICARIQSLEQWTESLTVGLYAAQSFEPNLAALLEVPGKTFCFPRVSGVTIDFHRCESLDQLRPNSWKLREPDPDRCPVVPATDIDLFCIPGLAFTSCGVRLGHGTGFYDRFLTRIHPDAVKLGICFQAQLFSDLPLENHDFAMDQIVTESEITGCAEA